MDWVETQEQIDMATLQARDPILFFEEVRLVTIRNHASGVPFHQKLPCCKSCIYKRLSPQKWKSGSLVLYVWAFVH